MFSCLCHKALSNTFSFRREGLTFMRIPSVSAAVSLQLVGIQESNGRFILPLGFQRTKCYFLCHYPAFWGWHSFSPCHQSSGATMLSLLPYCCLAFQSPLLQNPIKFWPPPQYPYAPKLPLILPLPIFIQIPFPQCSLYKVSNVYFQLFLNRTTEITFTYNSCFRLPTAGITRVSHHAWYLQFLMYSYRKWIIFSS